MRFWTFFLPVLWSLSSASAAVLSVDELMARARQESELVKAAEQNVQSIESEIRARDLLLGARLNAEVATINDDRDAVTFARRTRNRFFNFSLEKPFSTGTTVLMSAGHEFSRFDNFGERDTGTWQVRITQSLWRDFFGRGTELRHESERAELISRKAQALIEMQNFLITLENLYWDLSLAEREEKIRLKNIENGKRLERWTQQRASRSAAEKSDVYQAQALVSQATLDLLSAQNSIQQLRNLLRQYFPVSGGDEVESDAGRSLEKNRQLGQLVDASGALDIPQRLDSVAASHVALQAGYEADRVRDSLRPQVNAYVLYGQNGIADGFGNAWDRAGDSNHAVTQVGIVLSLDLNRSLVSEREKAARLAAEARRLQAETQKRVSRIGWLDLQRQISVLKSQADEAARLAVLQERKVIEERERFRLGRSTVFQMVTYELDAASAELNKYRALTSLRKAEGQARLFTRMEGVSS